MLWKWVLTDTIYFFLAGGVYEFQMNYYIFANKTDWKGKYIADIVGHSCYADRMLPQVNVPEIEK